MGRQPIWCATMTGPMASSSQVGSGQWAFATGRSHTGRPRRIPMLSAYRHAAGDCLGSRADFRRAAFTRGSDLVFALLQWDSRTPRAEEGRTVTATCSTSRHHRCHAGARRIASSLRADMIFGRDRSFPSSFHALSRTSISLSVLSRIALSGYQKPLGIDNIILQRAILSGTATVTELRWNHFRRRVQDWIVDEQVVTGCMRPALCQNLQMVRSKNLMKQRTEKAQKLRMALSKSSMKQPAKKALRPSFWG